MKKTSLLIALLSLYVVANAQDADTNKYWKLNGIFNLSIAQTGLVNWTAGGENSVSGNVLFKYSANYAKNKWTWDNDITVGYGGIMQGDSPWEKTDDRIELNTKVGREAAKKWYYTAFLNFRTQMLDGYKLPNDSDIISTWMAPGYITGGLGAEWKPDDYFSANISPVAGKITIVSNPTLADAGAYGVDPAEFDETTGAKTKDGAQYRYEFGGNITLQYKREVLKNVTVDTKLNLFSNYLENPQNIDVNWDFMLVMKVNKWLSASVTTNLIYDHDIDVPIDVNDDGVVDDFAPRTQFKEVIGVGLNLTF
jgi:hypothetical protein